MLNIPSLPKTFVLAVASFVLATAGTVASQPDQMTCSSGQVLEGLSLNSSLMQKAVNFAVYLPPDYHCSTRRYPVVYLLHGFTDDESGWIQFGEVNVSADQLIKAGEIPSMIIVMPDGGVTWYIDDYAGKAPFETMLLKELIPHVDATYRTRPKREFRGVSGLSMGGYGSLMFAMRNPDVFAACAAFSSGVMTEEEIVAMPDDRWDRVFSSLFGEKLRGQDRLNDHWKKYSPLSLAASLESDSLKKVRYYIDCGDDDFLYKGNAALHVLLRDRMIPHEYRVRDGAHEWLYWRTGIREGLKFIGESFRR